jgi:transcription initiation factor TFIIIB Brf1 subunit/transcription initiation factor TFIIB
MQSVASEIIEDQQFCPYCGVKLAEVDYRMVDNKGFAEMICVCGGCVDYRRNDE